MRQWSASSRAVEQADDGLGVAGVDAEEHGALLECEVEADVQRGRRLRDRRWSRSGRRRRPRRPATVSSGHPARDLDEGAGPRARHGRTRRTRRTCSGSMLSSITRSAPAATASSTCAGTVAFDFHTAARASSSRARADRAADARAAEMVVLDEHDVGERTAVVDAAAGADGGLLERAEPGKRLAGVPDTGCGGRHPSPPATASTNRRGERRDARQVAQEVQRGALAREHRTQRPFDASDRLALADRVAVGADHRSDDARGRAGANVSVAQAVPASTPSARATKSATPAAAAGTSAAVRSPSSPRSSASARATASRTRCTGGSSSASAMGLIG